MIHNKYFEILKQFLGDFHKEVYGRELLKKVQLSQKGIALALEELENKGILKSRKEGILKHYRLNLEYSEIKDIIAITEIVRKIEFLRKERKIAHMARQNGGIVGVFGSYAKGTNKKSSDLDVFIIGQKKKNDGFERGKTLGLQVSMKYFSRREWMKLLRQKNNLCREILENHVMISGTEDFLNLAWSNYYGFY